MRHIDGWWIPEAHLAGDVNPISSQWDEAHAQIAAALQHLQPDRRRACIQAGARVGLWPRILANHFPHVIAFEPDTSNFDCALLNCGLDRRIDLRPYALGRRKRYAFLKYSSTSDGEHHIALDPATDTERVPMYALDDLELPEHVDAIFLDVEGYELEALAGAERTLREHRPVLILEENSHCFRYGRARGDLEKWLTPRGYRLSAEFSTVPPAKRVRGAFHGADLIFTPA